MAESLRILPGRPPSDEELGPLLRRVEGEHKQAMLACAHGVLKDWHAAEGVVQEVMMNLWDAARQGGLTGHIGPWLQVVTYNAAVSQLRQTGQHRALFSDAPQHFEEAATAEGTSSTLTREAVSLLSELPERQAEAIRLVHLEGKDYGEAASVLGVTRATVRKYCWLGLRKLRERLEKNEKNFQA